MDGCQQSDQVQQVASYTQIAQLHKEQQKNNASLGALIAYWMEINVSKKLFVNHIQLKLLVSQVLMVNVFGMQE